ncbi:MAG: hypothetical protein CVV02_07100 [Firmicutes bacterium HGW-Firmicutes-7]|nr:MAG: hypothetical protein CVV02_07100 [Firmicutes bacterium HGW-Firmicutes-7]
MKKIRIPLFYKLFIAFILCSTIPMVIISGMMYGLSVNFLNKIMYEQTYNSIATAHERIDSKLEEYTDIILALQTDETIINVLSNGIEVNFNENIIYEKIFDTIKEQKIKPAVHIMNISGDLIFSTSPMPKVYEVDSKNSWGIFRDINKADGRSVVYPQQIVYSGGSNSIISLGNQILNEKGQCIGYIVVDIYRDIFLEELRMINSGIPLHIVMLDENLYTILDVQNPSMEGKFQRASYLDREKIMEFKSIRNEIKKDSYLTVHYVDDVVGITTTANVPSSIFRQLNSILQVILLVGCMISLSICCALSILIARYISNPIRELICIMGQVEEGSFNVKAKFNNNDEMGDLGKYFNRMVDRLKEYMNRVIEKQRELRTTEIKMLQAQLNPHFLYNTLDVIKWSTKLGQKDEVISVVTNLAKILRNSIDCEEEFVSVKKSIDFIESYLAIQKIKYIDTFNVIIDIEKEIFEYKIPRLILQPFIENAILHGLNNSVQVGIIAINGRLKEDGLEFEIFDNGIGMTGEEIQRISNYRTDQHIGIYNVDQRIKLYYGDEYGVDIQSEKYKGTKVIIKIPCSIGGNNL